MDYIVSEDILLPIDAEQLGRELYLARIPNGRNNSFDERSIDKYIVRIANGKVIEGIRLNDHEIVTAQNIEDLLREDFHRKIRNEKLALCNVCNHRTYCKYNCKCYYCTANWEVVRYAAIVAKTSKYSNERRIEPAKGEYLQYVEVYVDRLTGLSYEKVVRYRKGKLEYGRYKRDTWHTVQEIIEDSE